MLQVGEEIQEDKEQEIEHGSSERRSTILGWWEVLGTWLPSIGPNSIKHPLAPVNYCAWFCFCFLINICTCTYWTERQGDHSEGVELEREKLTCP